MASACHSTVRSYLSVKLMPSQQCTQKVCAAACQRTHVAATCQVDTSPIADEVLESPCPPPLHSPPPPHPPLYPQVMPDEVFTAIKHLNNNKFPGVCSIGGVNDAEVRRWLSAFCAVQSHPWCSEQTCWINRPYMDACNSTYCCALTERCMLDAYVALTKECFTFVSITVQGCLWSTVHSTCASSRRCNTRVFHAKEQHTPSIQGPQAAQQAQVTTWQAAAT